MTEPRTYLPLDADGHPDPDRVAVQLMQHRPGEHDALASWTGGSVTVVNGGAAVILPGRGGVVGLGDFALLRGNRFVVEHADGMSTRYQLEDEPDPNPPDG